MPTYIRSSAGCCLHGAPVELAEEFLEILAFELPIERLRRGFPVVLKIEQSLGEDVQVREVIWSENLSLHDREINLDLIEPTGVSGSMNELHDGTSRISLTQSLDSSLPAMYGTVVYNPEDATGIVVGWSRHHLFDQTVKRRDAIDRLAPAKHSGVVDIQCAEINPSPTAFVSILDAASTAGLTRLSWMEAAPRLDARLLVSADDEFIRFQGLVFPLAAIQIQKPACLFTKVWILGKDPTPVIPRPDRILVKPPPQRTAADGGD